MSEIELIRHYIEKELGEESYGEPEGYRFFTEYMFPHLASVLKLKEDWGYKELYLAVLEDMAKRMKIKRFKVYTVDELVKKVYVKIGLLDSILPM